DYDVYASQTYGLLDLWLHTQTTKTRVDLYTPQKGTVWDSPDPNADEPEGIVYGIFRKGDQASIVMVDLRNVNGAATMSKADLDMYAWRAIFNPYAKEGPSQVARVIYVLNGKVIEDYDPLGYGPPGDPNPGMRTLLA
ncbi:MAG: hypothetical protein ACREP9_14045, partial [Candidatus Dormibacteraceae bacterium]